MDRHGVIDGLGDVETTVAAMNKEIEKAPIDVGVIGIGENAHIAFNDPPADFKTKESFFLVTLDKKCKQQQVREGWFASEAEVPPTAITITPYAIMNCRHIISSVPFAVKADAILNTLAKKMSPKIPATILKTHPDWHLYLDAESAAKVFPL